MGQKIQVAHVQELQNGTPIATQVEGVELVVVPGSDSVAVFEGRCPHQGTLLAEGTHPSSRTHLSGARLAF